MTYPPGFNGWSLDKRNEWFAAENLRIVAKKRAMADDHFLAAQIASECPAKTAGVNLISAASVKPESVDWLWRGNLARGKLHIIAGAPGTGKTTLTMRMAAIVSSGGKWPDGSQCPPGNVLIWSGEDAVGDTLVPRLHAAGADLDRCYFVESIGAGDAARPFDPSKDFPALKEKIAQIGGASLLICDPVVSAITADSHKNSEVRRGLQPLVNLANEADCAVLGITHFSKGAGGRDPVERITGSIAFAAVARFVFVTAKEGNCPDGSPSERRIFVRAKSNHGPDEGGFAYTLTTKVLDGFDAIEAAVVTFGERLTGDARALLSAAEADSASIGGALAEAKDFLLDLLATGPVPAKECKRAAINAGISTKTLERAYKDLGVRPRKLSMCGGWEWNLPEGRQD